LQVDKIKSRVKGRSLHPVEKQIHRVTMSQLVHFIGAHKTFGLLLTNYVPEMLTDSNS
jgi:hypothetical protein